MSLSIVLKVIDWLNDNLSGDYKDFLMNDIYYEKKGFKLDARLHQYKTRTKKKQPYKIVHLKIKM